MMVPASRHRLLNIFNALMRKEIKNLKILKKAIDFVLGELRILRAGKLAMERAARFIGGGMNILVLNGSPRPEGNTAALVDAFTEGAKEAGHGVTVLNLGRKKIAGCIACEHCHNKGNGACIQKDDMQEVYAALEKAEMLVLASPVYYFTLTGQLQCAIQRIYAFKSTMPPKLKKTALILTSGDGDVYASSIQEYNEAFLGYMGTQDMGIITAYGDQNKSKKKLAEARALGKSLA